MDSNKRSVGEFFQQVWSQSLQTVTGAEEEVTKVVGRLQGMAGWSQDDVKRQVRELTERLSSQRRDAEKRVEETVRTSLSRLRVPRREEIEKLAGRIESLSKRVEALSK